ncbi:MAG: hypothetical protein AAGJ93_02645, partial [Bacteroidota bacterium]
EKEIETALFDAEMGGMSFFSDEMPLELMKEFQDRVRQFHSQEEEVAVGSLLPDDFHLLPPNEVNETIAQREIDRVLKALEAVNIMTDQPGHLLAVNYYAFLHDIILSKMIVPFDSEMKVFLPFDEFLDDENDQEAYDDIMGAAELFLLALFNLETAFPPHLLANEVRLGSEVVTREKALAHLNAWRAQFQAIVPLSFQPGMIEEDGTGTVFPTFLVAYQTQSAEGEKEELEGGGLVQLIFENDDFKVQGAQIPGFEF